MVFSSKCPPPPSGKSPPTLEKTLRPARRLPAFRNGIYPTVGAYALYDELIYTSMTFDYRRNDVYRAAIDQLAPGLSVVDIGTGKDLVLTRMCLDAGAGHIYAIERDRRAFELASALLQSLPNSGRVTPIHSDSATVQLPEPVDLCVSELLGVIGGCEGAAVILNAARRQLLKPGARMIPSRCLTQTAAVELPLDVAQSPAVAKPAGPTPAASSSATAAPSTSASASATSPAKTASPPPLSEKISIAPPPSPPTPPANSPSPSPAPAASMASSPRSASSAAPPTNSSPSMTTSPTGFLSSSPSPPLPRVRHQRHRRPPAPQPLDCSAPETQRMEVPVVICTCNGAARLPAVFARLQAQQGVESLAWEVVVVDNNSTDSTPSLVRQYQQSWPALRLESEPQQGLAHARSPPTRPRPSPPP